MSLTNYIRIDGKVKGKVIIQAVNDTQVARFRVVTKEYYKGKTYFNWFTAEVWGTKRVETIKDKLTDGSHIQLDGSMQMGSYKKTVGKGKSSYEHYVNTAVIRVNDFNIDNRYRDLGLNTDDTGADPAAASEEE